MPQLLYYKDGTATTVSVEQWGKTTALKNNGKVDASNGDDMGTQIMVGLMPLLFHPTALRTPPRVAVVGYGSESPWSAVTQFPIGHADVIELEPAVVEAGDRFFAQVSHLPSQNPQVQVLIGDGRNFATQSQSKYDVIVSEPSNPWITGVCRRCLRTTGSWPSRVWRRMESFVSGRSCMNSRSPTSRPCCAALPVSFLIPTSLPQSIFPVM